MLDQRLRFVADFVRCGSRIADIGTDHAHLPVALVQEGRCPSAIASDIRMGPVANARRTVKEAGLEEKIEVRLGGGLSTVQPHEVEDIVIAGMGGETVASILEAAPWVQNGRYRLILQPMTRAEKLRAYLFATGFSLCEERVALAGRHWYTVLCAEYTGKKTAFDDALCFVGRVAVPEGDGYLQTVENRLRRQQEACPTAEGHRCLQQIGRYRSGRWKPWEESQ